GGDEEAVAVLVGGLQGHGQDALDGTGLAGESQLADDGERAGAVEGDLTAAQEQSQGDGQVEAARVLLEIGRGRPSGEKSWCACLHAPIEPEADPRRPHVGEKGGDYCTPQIFNLPREPAMSPF